MALFSAVLDACALVPIAPTDTLLRLAEADFYRPVWSSRILYEARHALEKVHPDMRESGAAERRMEAMDHAFEDACVAGWEDLVEGISGLPDKEDRHVVAAAILGRADVIVTWNLRDFPGDVLRTHNLEAQTPDEFLLNQLDLRPSEVLRVLERQAAATKNPPLAFDDVLDALEHAGATEFARCARKQRWRISSVEFARVTVS